MLYFVSSNNNKYLEARSFLTKVNIRIKFLKLTLREIQSDSIKEIGIEKAKSAFNRVYHPIIVEDDGLFINSLNGFPGHYSSYIFKTIGIDGILKLLMGSIDKSALFRSIIVFYDGKYLETFIGQTKGHISNKITNGGWGYDPIFIPNGSDTTYGQLQLENRKTEFSHRRKSLEKFRRWYKEHRIDNN
jgi:XTP/dITP diphosphohydrolase